MLSVNVVASTGKMAVIECEGRIVRSEAAFKLRQAVTSLRDARIIVLDFSEVPAIEGGGLGMLVFLQRWAHDHDIRLRLFNPRHSVRDRLKRANSMSDCDIATLDEVMGLIAGAYDELPDCFTGRGHSENDCEYKQRENVSGAVVASLEECHFEPVPWMATNSQSG